MQSYKEITKVSIYPADIGYVLSLKQNKLYKWPCKCVWENRKLVAVVKNEVSVDLVAKCVNFHTVYKRLEVPDEVLIRSSEC